ncbi:MAG TPA: CBS domain-containing protein [Candidatus Polarisedimenticolia bacterium]|nr:CBS domain-containing protein [Candidatus Polarisedimenticolia bacterium]
MTIEEALRRERLRALRLEPPVTVSSGTPLGQGLLAMREAGGAAVLVLKEGRTIGIFTERDVLNKLFPGCVDESLPIDRFMTPDPAGLTLDATLGEAVRLMTEHGYRNVPLQDRDGKSAGLVSARDVVQYVAEHFPTEVANLPPGLNQRFVTKEGA